MAGGGRSDRAAPRRPWRHAPQHRSRPRAAAAACATAGAAQAQLCRAPSRRRQHTTQARARTPMSTRRLWRQPRSARPPWYSRHLYPFSRRQFQWRSMGSAQPRACRWTIRSIVEKALCR
eukprot:3974021-Pleurochrysis_carterae.AAC.2